MDTIESNKIKKIVEKCKKRIVQLKARGESEKASGTYMGYVDGLESALPSIESLEKEIDRLRKYVPGKHMFEDGE